MVQHNQPVPSDSFVFIRTGHRIRNRAMLAAMTNKQSHSDGTLSEALLNVATKSFLTEL